MANFNGFDDVRQWVAVHDFDALQEAVRTGAFSGKTLAVARAYLEHVEEHGGDVVEADDEDDDPKWEWNAWRISIVAAFLIGPPVLVWALNTWVR